MVVQWIWSGVKDLEKGHFKRRKRSINHEQVRKIIEIQEKDRKKNMHFYDKMSSQLKEKIAYQ